jgi:hypothetical protein
MLVMNNVEEDLKEPGLTVHGSRILAEDSPGAEVGFVNGV